MKTFAVDFETYYDKDCSIRILGPLGYFSHPDFEAYLVSIVGDDGYVFCGHPKDVDWSLLDGQRVLSHNASFDETLYLFGVTKKWWGPCYPAEWHCTADMAAYCDLPRSLKGAVEAALGIEISKNVRDNMQGVRPADFSESFYKDVEEYAIADSQLCLSLWQKLSDKWPELERQISKVNRKALQRGVPIDPKALSDALGTINTALHEAEKSIPWAGYAPILSRNQFDEHCRLVGITPPKSLAMGDEGADQWMAEHSPKFVWVEAVRNYRRINALKRKLESFDYATLSNGRYYGAIMYFGASATGRFSGSGGNLNLQNLPRGDLFGVNLRSLIRAPKGKKLVVVDLSQIEVRTLCWLAGDSDTLDLIAKHDDIYEAFAIKYGLWKPESGRLRVEGSSLRTKIIKPTTLGCGYQASANRLHESTDMTLEEAESAVATYRQSMPKVVSYWGSMQGLLQSAFVTKKPLAFRLPSGRVLNYGPIEFRKKVVTNVVPDPTCPGKPLLKTEVRREYFCVSLKQSRRVTKKLYGGLITENLSQGLARDIFSDALVRIDKAGHKILFHVHDEVVLEVDDEEAEKTLEDVIRIMSTAPDWIPDIPLSSEGSITEIYTK